MFSIGDFARLGLVSVRMLRHYDGIGLLPPAHVDDATGYRRGGLYAREVYLHCPPCVDQRGRVTEFQVPVVKD